MFYNANGNAKGIKVHSVVARPSYMTVISMPSILVNNIIKVKRETRMELFTRWINAKTGENYSGFSYIDDDTLKFYKAGISKRVTTTLSDRITTISTFDLII